MSEFDELKELLYSDAWPSAVPPLQICDEADEDDKMQRGEGLLSFVLDAPIQDKKFLDFGCGEGHAAKAAGGIASIAVGYDLLKSGGEWETLVYSGSDKSHTYMTQLFSTVKSMGPYDAILVYDVLDHADNPAEALDQIKQVCRPGTYVFIRFHPWCSRHGGHFYQKLNKAFIQLVFTTDELAELGLIEQPPQKVYFPLSVYNHLLQPFHIIKETVDRQQVDDFFMKNKLVRDRIIKNWQGPINGFPTFQMEQCFVDFNVTV